jgi:hypothetical protein
LEESKDGSLKYLFNDKPNKTKKDKKTSTTVHSCTTRKQYGAVKGNEYGVYDLFMNKRIT